MGRGAPSSCSMCTASLCLQPPEMVPGSSCDPAGTVWREAERSARIKDPLVLPWPSLGGSVLCAGPGSPAAAGQAEHWVVTHCLFLCPAATSAIRKPCTSGNRRRRERRHSYVLLILFSFESSNSFQFTYSRRSPTQKFSGSCMNNPKTMQIKLAGQKQLEIGPQASAVICLEEGDGRQEHHLPSELSCRITSPQVLNLLVSLQA